MKLAMIGAGYVGLVTAACFAEMGNEVTCVDADSAKVEALEQGIIPIYEPGLEDYIRRNTQENRLSFTTDLAAAVQHSLVVFIAVGTPQDRDGSADLSMVLQVARDIGRHMDGKRDEVFIDDHNLGVVEGVRRDPKEDEADNWANAALIPPDVWKTSRVGNNPSPIAVVELARRLGIHPAIVAGRVRHETKNFRLLSHFVGTGEVRRQLLKTSTE